MAGTFKTLDLFALSCLFLTVESQQDQSSQNVYLHWISDFEPQLIWEPPASHSLENCSYEVNSSTNEKNSEIVEILQSPVWHPQHIVMEGGFIHLSIKTLCNEFNKSFHFNITYPELVRNLQCYIHSLKQTNCSWLPASNAQDLRFFYWLANEDSTESATDNSPLPPLQECPLYNITGGIRIGCSLRAEVTQDVHILFNATLNNTLVRNTFKRQLHKNVRPPPLNWTVTKTKDQFHISWIPPEIVSLSLWMFTINYTACQKTMFKTIRDQMSTTLDVIPYCQYWISIQATGWLEERAQMTPWSEQKYFDADTDPYVLVYVAIVIPLMFAILAALTLVFCRKNKENIFPKIPEPRDLISSISDNNNKSTVCNLYPPKEEEDYCKISLVTEINKLH